MRKTIKNVMMVVPVLITSCHVSLKPKIGPVTAQMTINNNAKRNAPCRPLARDKLLVRSVYQFGDR
jgi:hypothetical protein